ncbi:MAG: hypothetical protein IJ545_06805 [Alphaproteobacteria bacterium]|nr:hypothetical protein [Alphaproteobacteria bacterium]
MNNFNFAVNMTLRREGVLCNDPKDTGGLTKYGISKTAYPNLDICALTQDDAIAIYKRDYWNASKCELLPFPLDVLTFDAAVNHGIKPAIKILQRALKVTDDGIIGPKTIEAARKAPDNICTLYFIERMWSYSQARTYNTHGKGWRNRLEAISTELNI